MTAENPFECMMFVFIDVPLQDVNTALEARQNSPTSVIGIRYIKVFNIE